MSYCLSCIGIFLTLLGGSLCVLTNFNVGTLLTLLLGILLTVYGAFYAKIRNITKRGVWKWVRRVLQILLCFELVLVLFLGVYGHVDSANGEEDALIILGAGIRGDRVTLALQHRLDRAIEYHKEHPQALLVVTGGQGIQETVTEAYAMEQYLLAQGIPKEQILKEERATSTEENMRFSKEILDEIFGESYRVSVVTNHFHCYRGVAYAKKAGFSDVTHLGARLTWHSWIPCYLRESLAVLKLWLLE